MLTEKEATVANPSPAYTDEDMVILSGVEKEHKSNVYGYIRAFDLQVWMVLLCFLLVAAGIAVAAEILVRMCVRTMRLQRYQAGTRPITKVPLKGHFIRKDTMDGLFRSSISEVVPYPKTRISDVVRRQIASERKIGTID